MSDGCVTDATDIDRTAVGYSRCNLRFPVTARWPWVSGRQPVQNAKTHSKYIVYLIGEHCDWGLRLFGWYWKNWPHQRLTQRCRPSVNSVMSIIINILTFNLLSIIWIATVFSLAKSACSSAGVFATFDENDMNMIWYIILTFVLKDECTRTEHHDWIRLYSFLEDWLFRYQKSLK